MRLGLRTRYKVFLYISHPSGEPMEGEDAACLDQAYDAAIQAVLIRGLHVRTRIRRQSWLEALGCEAMDLWAWLRKGIRAPRDV